MALLGPPVAWRGLLLQGLLYGEGDASYSQFQTFPNQQIFAESLLHI